MQKTQELLLMLSHEERDAAEDFINRELKFLGANQLTDLEDVASSGWTALEEIQQNGHLAILKAREKFQAEEIAPFRGYCQTINPIYQKKNQKVKRIQRQERLLEEAGLQ